MSTTRLHIKNLPSGVDEQSMINFFKGFGEISDIAIKNDYGFFSTSASSDKIEKFIQKTSGQKWMGNVITIAKAKKENFMARLAKERQSNVPNKHSPAKTDVKEVSPVEVPKKKRKRKDSSESSSDDGGKAGIPKFRGTGDVISPVHATLREDDTMKKLADFDSMWGEDEEEDNANFSTYLKASKKSEKKEKLLNTPKKSSTGKIPATKEEKKLRDDERRRKTIEEREKERSRHKAMISSALSSVDSRKSNKIVFEDEEKEDIGLPNEGKVRLFDEDDHDDLVLPEKSQFEGAKGEKLFRLQSRFNNDERFAMDERFLEDGGEEEKKIVKTNEMVRFDPTSQLLFKSPIEPDTEAHEPMPLPADGPIVSSEKFYEVSENMQSALKANSSGFSLLAAYGADRGSSQSVGAKGEMTMKQQQKRRFPMDDSSTDEEPNAVQEEEIINEAWKTPVIVSSSEKFFFSENDPLFKEAMEFINKKGSEEAKIYAENFEETRRILKKVFRDQATRRSKKTSMFRHKVGEKRRFAPSGKFAKAPAPKRSVSKSKAH